MADPRQLLRLGGAGITPGAHAGAGNLAGMVSLTQPAPQGVTDPLYVVVPGHSTSLGIPVSRWAPIYGSDIMPVPGAQALVVYDQTGRPYVPWWELVPLPYGWLTNGLGQSWRPVFQDDFNGTSLNAARWGYGWYPNTPTSITPPIVAGQLACFRPANVSVSGGNLVLTMTAGSYTDQASNSYGYATGMVNTAPSEGFGGILFDFAYGYAEARIYTPGSGSMDNWPAWFMLGIASTGIGWPTHGELDVMEGLSGQAWGNWHGATSSTNATEASFGTSAGFAGTGWHVYGAKWTNSGVHWYYDGVLQPATGSVPAYQSGTPMYLILANQANTSGTPAQTSLLVDYVRVWQGG